MSEIVAWRAPESLVLPVGASEPAAIVPYARQLSQRDRDQIVAGFASQHYEMVTTFVWAKGMTALKERLRILGAEFVSEMLDRPDITASSNLVHTLSDADAVRLAEDLGMLNSTQAMRLRNAMSLIQHFTSPPDDADPTDRLERHEAIGCLKSTVQAILGHERLDVAVEFTRFRRLLEETVLDAGASEIATLTASPYFFRRTTVRVLLALMKSGSGIQLENASGNMTVILPALWGSLLKADRWDIGRAYAEVHSEGKAKAAAGIRRALLKVQGFDYVPENLRSVSFLTAANEVLEAHHAGMNFYNEPRVMKALADLGKVIPSPALAKCMTATLSVWLGNPYGHSWAAEEYADQVLNGLTAERWLYFFDDCLPADEAILGKLQAARSGTRWFALIERRGLALIPVVNPLVRALLESSVAKNWEGLQRAVVRLRQSVRPLGTPCPRCKALGIGLDPSNRSRCVYCGMLTDDA